MHPNITQEIGRLQVDEMVSRAHLARRARRAGPGSVPAPSRARRPWSLRVRAPRVTTGA